MNRVARELLVIARKLVFDEDILFIRDDKTDDRVFNQIYHDLQAQLDRIRRNEGVETFTGRRDDGSAMELSVGVSEHEAKDAIVKHIKVKAKALGRKYGVRVIV